MSSAMIIVAFFLFSILAQPRLPGNDPYRSYATLKFFFDNVKCYLVFKLTKAFVFYSRNMFHTIILSILGWPLGIARWMELYDMFMHPFPRMFAGAMVLRVAASHMLRTVETVGDFSEHDHKLTFVLACNLVILVGGANLLYILNDCRVANLNVPIRNAVALLWATLPGMFAGLILVREMNWLSRTASNDVVKRS